MKHKSLTVAIALPILDDKAANCTIFKEFFKHLIKRIILFTYLLPAAVYHSSVHDVEALLDIWHDLQQSALQLIAH